jgi:hypothetical protein
VFSTTTTREAPRSSTATSRAVDCSEVVTRRLSHTNDRGRPYRRSDHGGIGHWSSWQMTAADYPRLARMMRRDHGLWSRQARRSLVRVN